MPEFRSIPAQINAVQLLGISVDPETKKRAPVFSHYPHWIESAMGMGNGRVGGMSIYDGRLWLNGVGGPGWAEDGDWICTRRVGDLFVVRGANFNLLYEPIEKAETAS